VAGHLVMRINTPCSAATPDGIQHPERTPCCKRWLTRVERGRARQRYAENGDRSCGRHVDSISDAIDVPRRLPL